ncbi:hypothetical protein C5167_044608 [Papaver somniferum]|uniref:Uncharacterized protein n=1 Tax=Papaver somniferum TaxID=3469 RepID=A0A4Y7LBL6_PAPSO|nr:hypothetical protein C5167_044608 [Papaver somniferum]
MADGTEEVEEKKIHVFTVLKKSSIVLHQYHFSTQIVMMFCEDPLNPIIITPLGMGNVKPQHFARYR